MSITPREQTVSVKYPFYVLLPDSSAVVPFNDYPGRVCIFADTDNGYVLLGSYACQDVIYNPPDPMTVIIPGHICAESTDIFTCLFPDTISDSEALAMINDVEP
jgi:hypothetical protein